MLLEVPLNMENVDWGKLSHALDFYRALGFKYHETDWLQTSSDLSITAPDQDHIIMTNLNNLGLIGSSEQSFVRLALDGLPDSKYVSCSPCFRNEETRDHLHQRQFMKVELFQTEYVTLYSLQLMVETALRFFNAYAPAVSVRTDEGYDIEVNGIEVGSYGIRQHRHVRWIYGTGCAEPRLSQAITANIS